MSYVRTSTANPLGRKPWNAMLQPGGLGAFFPNAEAIGAPSVMVDRDAANPGGWKNAYYAGAPLPRIYYHPDAFRQYTTQRAQGLGAGHRGSAPVTSMPPTSPTLPGYVHAIFSPAPAPVQPVIALPSGYVPATPESSPSQTVTDPTTVPATTPPATTNYVRTIRQFFHATTPSGATVVQSTGTATDTAAATDVSTAGTPVPAGYPTSQSYTDAAGNVWAYSGGQWQIIDASGGSSAVSLSSWLTENTIWSAVPNWGVLLGGAGVLWFLTKKK